ncbi:hypothetical protein BD626DRAFT_450552 [Schizophyllum amplum]|uniref:Short-chain dehydrogenase/reductase 3 n=1 Tax=Schizophyllum amplum TaxID=97359 RepID=A0A550CTS6_9AGAR|nr:hypothetical protein BD626DRAFT_450552 [Auriculariopsis ampla]
MGSDERTAEPSLMFDNVDIDMVVKVLSHTAFGPFFLFLVPAFFFFQGAPLSDPLIVYSFYWFLAVCAFWLIKWSSTLYRNQGSFLFGPPPLDWGEQVVLITGGSSGIGELLANTLAVRNVNVVVLDVQPIATDHYNISYYKCDVSKWEEVEAVAKTVIEEIGQPTIIVNNAGIVQAKLILDLSPAEIERTFAVNTLSHFWTLKAFLPGMIEQKTGHVITMSSALGFAGTAQMTDYNASKAAVISLNKSLRYELDKRYHCPGIRTTVVCPGHVWTKMFRDVRLPNWPLFQFLAPSIPPVTVVKEIIQAIDEQNSQEILLPFYVKLIPYTQLLPSFLVDLAQGMSGADYAYAHLDNAQKSN